MFEAAEIKHKVDKATFEREEPRLREALIAAQKTLAEKEPFEVVILIAGLAGAGKGDVLATLNEWMDPRLVETADCDDPSDEEHHLEAPEEVDRREQPAGEEPRPTAREPDADEDRSNDEMDDLAGGEVDAPEEVPRSREEPGDDPGDVEGDADGAEHPVGHAESRRRPA